MNSDERLGQVCIVVPAAGKGARMGGSVAKQYLPVNGKPLLQHTLDQLLALNAARLLLVVSAEDEQHRNLPQVGACTVVTGGASRADSVLNALRVLDAADGTWVMVHDGARPCVRREDIVRLIESVGDDDVGGLLAVPVADTVKQAGTAGEEGCRVATTVDRSLLWQAQTPQLFRYGLLLRALEDARQAGFEVTDEASAVERLGCQPLLVKGHKDNIKVTTPEDLILAGRCLDERGTA